MDVTLQAYIACLLELQLTVIIPIRVHINLLLLSSQAQQPWGLSPQLFEP